MGLIALILSVAVDVLHPLHGEVSRSGRSTRGQRSRQASGPVALGAAEFSGHPVAPAAHWLITRFADSADSPSDAVEAATAEAASLPPDTSAGLPQLGVLGWLGAVGLPVAAAVLFSALVGSVAWVFSLLFHVAVLYLAVGLGPFYRMFSELRLLVGAGENLSARALLRRWSNVPEESGDGGFVPVTAAGGGAASINGAVGIPDAGDAADTADSGDEDDVLADPSLADVQAGPGIERQAIALSLLVAFRSVFAPLFWYLVLPGVIGPVLYLFARLAAIESTGFARTAYRWLDWLPMRVAAVGFALAGQFEETVYAARSLGSVAGGAPSAPESGAASAQVDPYVHQRLFLLPVAGGALGLTLMDSATEATVRHLVPDFDQAGATPQAGSLRAASGLLLRSAVIWFGVVLLIRLLF